MVFRSAHGFVVISKVSGSSGGDGAGGGLVRAGGG